MTRIFISFSHDSPAHQSRVQDLAHRLRGDHFEVHLDTDVTAPPQGWPRWMNSQIQRADFILVVCTEIYKRRFEGEEEQNAGRGVDFEGLIITQRIYEEKKNTNVVPVLLDTENRQHIPSVLGSATSFHLPDKYGQLLKRLGHPSVRPAKSTAPAGGRAQTSALPAEARDLARRKPFRDMLKIAYLMLRIDRYTDRLSTPDRYRQDGYLWGWSVCDPRRKKMVAKPQALERRAASIVVTSFVLGGFFEDVPRFGLRSRGVRTDLVSSLQRRFSLGIFGTWQTSETGIHRRLRLIVVPNCRHIAAAIDILLRLLALEKRTPSVIGLAHTELRPQVEEALQYLHRLPDMALFSEDPDAQSPLPDVATCAIVLGMLEHLENVDQLIFEDQQGIGRVQPMTREELRKWRAQALNQGITFLSNHQQKARAGPRLWQYPPPGKKSDAKGAGSGLEKGSADSSTACDQDTTPPGEPLYHTARILYLTRNLLANAAYNESLLGIAEDLAKIARDGLLPAWIAQGERGAPHITNTAFFLSALLPRHGGPPTETLAGVLLHGLQALPKAFFEAVETNEFELLDLRTDGFGMLLRLGRKLMTHEERSAFAEELRSVHEVSDAIQEAIQDERIHEITNLLRNHHLEAAEPLVMDRVVEARRLWLAYVRASTVEPS